MDDLASPIVLGILPHSRHLAERFRFSALATGWQVRTIDHASATTSPLNNFDIIVLIVEHIASAQLTWIAEAAHTLDVPLVVIANDQDPQIIADVLGAGADEYIAYPFAAEELVARVESLVLRARGAINIHAPTWIDLDHRQRSITDGIRRVLLSQREWSVLLALLDHCGQVVSVDELSRLGGSGQEIGSPAAIISAISRLRKRLGQSSFDALAIETIHGRGYAIRLRAGTRISG